MFKTIFSKLVAMFIVVLAIAFFVTGITLNYFLDNFLTQEKVKTLEKSSDAIFKWTIYFLNNMDDPVANFYFQSNLQIYSDYAKAYIWIVDDKGHIVYSQPQLPLEIRVKYTDNTGYVKLPDENQYTDVFQRQGDPVREIGDFYGFFSERSFAGTYNDDSWLTVEKAYKYFSKDGKNNALAVYMHTPVPEVQNARKSVFIFFFISSATALLISIILIYAFSLRLTRPLKEIRNAAKTIASGEFKKRLNIKSRDEIGQLAQSFDQMAVALQNIEEMRRGFIANVSHELRTPMTSIRGFIEGILDGTIPPERQGYYLTIVRDETHRLNRLVNNLLDLARMEAGEVELKPRIFDIHELIRLCVIKLETLIVEKEIHVDAQFGEEDMYVSADSDAIERVLYNLVHNAIKFTPEGGKITIATVARKEVVEVSVADTGIGISPDEIDLIWDRFYKADKSRSRDKVGTGLGLAIVKTIINEHNQEIRVESEPGRGTCFTFTLRKVEKPDNT